MCVVTEVKAGDFLWETSDHPNVRLECNVENLIYLEGERNNSIEIRSARYNVLGKGRQVSVRTTYSSVVIVVVSDALYTVNVVPDGLTKRTRVHVLLRAQPTTQATVQVKVT